MERYGLLFDIDSCVGCNACTVACKQEHGYDEDTWGIKVTERKISIEELAEAYKAGALKEAFGTGTAAVISPIGELAWGETVMKLTDGKIGGLSQKLYDEITGIQRCEKSDPFGWVYTVIE